MNYCGQLTISSDRVVKKALREKEALWGQVCMGALITQSDQGQVGRKSCSRAYKEWAEAEREKQQD